MDLTDYEGIRRSTCIWYIAYLFKPRSLDGVDWSDSRPGRFTRKGKRPRWQRTGGLVDLRVFLCALERKKRSCPCQDSN